MKNEQKVKAYAMRLDGYSIQEIADHFGVSRKAIQQSIPKIEKCAINAPKKCAYPNIKKWMCKNNIRIKDLMILCGMSYQTISRLICGEGGITKKNIDKFLEATKMTYEEAFMMD